MPRKRYLNRFIREDLETKMVFVVGPRQVGKTTLAKQLQTLYPSFRYFLWDKAEHRRELLRAQWPAEPTLVVLDELHKYPKWKRWLKGEFDLHKERHKFLVTGSARMDIYRRGGDSLQGRYHHYRLHPFTLNEFVNRAGRLMPGRPLSFASDRSEKELDLLWRFSGFPEPALAGSERTHRRWQKERLERFFREEVRDLTAVRELGSLQMLADLLPLRVGAPLSLNALREDLEVSHKAVSSWVNAFERLYFLFRVPPYHVRTLPTLKKEGKVYLYDWTLVRDEGARFENLVASHLLKACHFLEDTEGYDVKLFYLRDVSKREVDFLVTFDRQPWFAVEAKTAEESVSPALRYFRERVQIPFWFQVVRNGSRDFVQDGIRVMPARKFLSALV